MGENENAYAFSLGNPEAIRHFENLAKDGSIITNSIEQNPS
jgi:hypothetical protein